MDTFIAMLFEAVCILPGAFLRWVFFYKKSKTLKEVLKTDPFKNSFIGSFVIVTLFGIVFSILS